MIGGSRIGARGFRNQAFIKKSEAAMFCKEDNVQNFAASTS